jgi:hypothetical protein
MSPTSYQTAPPRTLIINNACGIVKLPALGNATCTDGLRALRARAHVALLYLDSSAPHRIQRPASRIELGSWLCDQAFY